MVCRGAKIIRRGDDWFVYITVQAEIPEKNPSSILAVDLGVRNIATTVNSTNRNLKFYGKKLRTIRGHYFHLRRKLPNRKAITKIGDHEKRIANHALHKISKAIVQEAVGNNSLIVIGELKGIRRNRRSRIGNRKLNSFPYYKLVSFIEYKANWQGIPVLRVDEAYTSQTCSRCGNKGLRVGGLFYCPHCRLNLNADYNGAKNIMKRALGKLHGEPLSSVGAGLAPPKTSPTDSLSLMMREESHRLQPWECQQKVLTASKFP